jgi:tetratricopeptide (TPR) repeat protein
LGRADCAGAQEWTTGSSTPFLDRQAGTNKKEYDKAIADYTDAIRVDPGNAAALNGRGDAWANKKEYAKAIADYAEAIKLDPKDARSHYNRGTARTTTQDYDKAIADFTEAIRLNPEDAGAYNLRAWIWATCPDKKHRDGEKAVESATMACELTKWNDDSYLETLAAACAAAGDFESALKWHTKANVLRSKPVEKNP